MPVEHMHGSVARHHTPTMDRILEVREKAEDRKKEVDYWNKKKGITAQGKPDKDQKNADKDARKDQKNADKQSAADQRATDKKAHFESKAEGKPGAAHRSSAVLDGVPQPKVDGVTEKEDGDRIGSDLDANVAGSDPQVAGESEAGPQTVQPDDMPEQRPTSDGGMQVSNVA